jgi:hypothetical protein
MTLIKMLTSGLVNQKRARFEEGFPQIHDRNARTIHLVKPFVQTGIFPILAKSNYVKPLDQVFDKTQVLYDDIFGKKMTADQRNYLAQQVLSAKRGCRAGKKRVAIKQNLTPGVSIPEKSVEILQTTNRNQMEGNSVLFTNIVSDSNLGQVDINGDVTDQLKPLIITPKDIEMGLPSPKTPIDTEMGLASPKTPIDTEMGLPSPIKDTYFPPMEISTIVDTAMGTVSPVSSPIDLKRRKSDELFGQYAWGTKKKKLNPRITPPESPLSPGEQKLYNMLEAAIYDKPVTSLTVPLLLEIGVKKAEIANGLQSPVNERRRKTDHPVTAFPREINFNDPQPAVEIPATRKSERLQKKKSTSSKISKLAEAKRALRLLKNKEEKLKPGTRRHQDILKQIENLRDTIQTLSNE